MFNGTGNELPRSVLGSGAHSLGVRVVTRHAMRASIAASVTVSASVRVPGALIGTFTRNVTAADDHDRCADPNSILAGFWKRTRARTI